MWTWFFTGEPVTNYAQAAKSDTAAFGRFHRAMLEQGIGCRLRSLRQRSSAQRTAKRRFRRR